MVENRTSPIWLLGPGSAAHRPGTLHRVRDTAFLPRAQRTA